MPEASVDPVVMAASTVLRLQGIVSREVPPTEAAVVTLGVLQAGTKENVIPDEAIIKLNVRTFDEEVRKLVLAAIERIVNAEAEASGGSAETGDYAAGPLLPDNERSVLFLFNHAPAETNFNVRFGMPSGPWMKVYKLAPMETRAISINELIRVQEPDDQGHKLVLNSTSGEVGWQASSTQVAGRILQASPAMGMARNFSCQGYFYQCSISVTPNSSLNLTVGSSGNLGDITPVVDTIYGTLPSACACNSSPSDANLSLTYSWGTSAIASLTAGEGLSFSTWKGTSAGSSTIPFSTEQSPYNIICNGRAPVTVTCTPPTAPDPGSVSRISYQITAVTSPPFPPLSTTYGETSAHPVSYDFTPYLSGNTWKARLTTASGSAQTWVRLLPRSSRG